MAHHEGVEVRGQRLAVMARDGRDPLGEPGEEFGRLSAMQALERGAEVVEADRSELQQRRGVGPRRRRGSHCPVLGRDAPGTQMPARNVEWAQDRDLLIARRKAAAGVAHRPERHGAI